MEELNHVDQSSVNGLILDECDTGASRDVYNGMCDCYCKSQGCRCDCHDCAFWQNGP